MDIEKNVVLKSEKIKGAVLFDILSENKKIQEISLELIAIADYGDLL